MPLPLLFIGIAAVTGAVGAGKTVKAGVDTASAKKINRHANDIVTEAGAKLDNQRQACGTALEKLGEEKLFILNNSISAFLDTFEQIKNVDFTEVENLDELTRLHIDQKTFEDLGEMRNFATAIAGGTAAGTAGGLLTAFGAYGAAATFASASTGTAIASLSGAAATNATLAFFGGGSLAAGGLGMAGGAAVLGGLVAGPALLVLGFVAGAHADKNLDKAYTNKAEAEELTEQLDTASFQCEAIRRRTYMFYSLLARLDSYFLPLIYRMENIVAEEGVDYRLYSIDSKKAIASVTGMAGAIKTVLDSPILSEEGELTEESKEVLNGLKDNNSLL